MAYATMLLVVETAGCGHSSSDTDQVSFTFNGRAYSLPPAVMGLSRTPSEVIAGRLELLRQLVAGLHRLAVIVRDDPDLDHRPTWINANSAFSEPRSLAVARSEIEARHRNCPLDRGLPRKYAADPHMRVAVSSEHCICLTKSCSRRLIGLRASLLVFSKLRSHDVGPVELWATH